MNLNTVIQSDALDFLKSLPSGSVDMILTSPPYDNLRKYKGFTWDFEGIARESYRVLKSGGVMVWVVGDSVIDGSESLTSLKQAIYFKETVGYRCHQTMIFHDPGTPFPDPTRYTRQFEYMFVLSKGRPVTINLLTGPNKWAGDKRPEGSIKLQREQDGTRSVRRRKPVKQFGTLGNVWVIGTGHGKSTKYEAAFDQGAIFPEKLAERHIATWTNQGDLVCDFFMGSGTTADVARRMGRHYIGCDISPEYVQDIHRRLAQPYTMPLPIG